VKALRIAAWFVGVHAVLATIGGIAGLVNAFFVERHVPSGDVPFFAAFALVAPLFAGWTILAARRASGFWLVSRALGALALCVLYALAIVGSISYASIGGMGSPFFAAMTFVWAWVAIPELLVIGGAIAARRAAATSSTSSS